MVEQLRIGLTLLTIGTWCCLSPLVLLSQERERGRASRQVFRDRVVAHWSKDGNRFWYRVDVGQGKKEFLLVDAESGSRQPAFDHAAVAKAIGNEATAERLPIERIEFTSNKDVWLLHGTEQRWAWNRATQKEEPLDGLTAESASETTDNNNTRPARTGAENRAEL